MSAIEKFIVACGRGDEAEEVRRLVGQDPALLNQQNQYGRTGLMAALSYGRHSISRWLLEQTGLDVAVSDDDNMTGLHYAYYTPLDIVVRLVQLSSQQTINQQSRDGRTALDCAVLWIGDNRQYDTSAGLYLSWLGAACKPKNKRADPVTVHSWIQAGEAEDAQLCIVLY